jgi:hypothetical protein
MKNSLSYKKALHVALFCALNLLFIDAFAQSSRSVAVSNFNGIGVSSGINLHLKQSDKESLVIKGDSELIKDVVVEKKQESINIRYKSGINWSRLFSGKSIDVYVTFKDLHAIAASGGADVTINGVLRTNQLALAASGGADVELAIDCKNITIAASGGADIELKGVAQNMTLNASGGSDVDAFDLKVDYAQVNASGGADANIFVNKALSAAASGGADVNYKGNAAVRKNNSKSGDINYVK